MKLIPVAVEKDGRLRLSEGSSLPANSRLAVFALAENESAGGVVAAIAEASGAFDFLVEEPDLYRDTDVIPGRANPAFRRRSRDVQAG
jgi:hypothetical protein